MLTYYRLKAETDPSYGEFFRVAPRQGIFCEDFCIWLQMLTAIQVAIFGISTLSTFTPSGIGSDSVSFFSKSRENLWLKVFAICTLCKGLEVLMPR